MIKYEFRWDVIPANIDFLLSGLSSTLIISATTLVLAMLGGLIIAVMGMSKFIVLRLVALSIGELVRNTPILIQLLWIYYVLPIVMGINLDSWTALVLGLSIYSSAFIAEAYRAGIQAIPVGHSEAAAVLGLSPSQTFFRIIFPQAVRVTLPPLAANFVQLIKYSSLGAVISVGEITRQGMELSASIFRPLEIFTFIAIVYFLICWPLSMGIRYLEKRLSSR
jgi:polar amino acid transport system permease protein